MSPKSKACLDIIRIQELFFQISTLNKRANKVWKSRNFEAIYCKSEKETSNASVYDFSTRFAYENMRINHEPFDSL